MKASSRKPMLERLLALAGIGTLAFGVAFVMGALKEKEPRAAEMGLRVFGGAGAGLLALSAILRICRRQS